MPKGHPLSDWELAALRGWLAGQCMAMAQRLAREGRPAEAARWAEDAKKYGPPAAPGPSSPVDG